MSLEGIFGNDLYTDHGRLRADDLAVRNRLADLLARGAGALRAAAVDYQRHYVPRPTRAQPFPSAEVIEPARRADRLAAEVSAAADAVRNVSFPDPEKVWFRVRADHGSQLVSFDRSLVAHAEYVAVALGVGSPARALAGGDLAEFDAAGIREALRNLLSVLADRETWLRGS